MTDRDRSRSRSPDRNGGDHRGDSGGAGEEVKLYIGNLDYGA
jgi:hypothetical protein